MAPIETKDIKCIEKSQKVLYCGQMEILEIVGESIAANDAELGQALRRVEETVKAQKAKDTSADEKQRIRDIIALCFEYDREEDKEEQRNIEETLRELIMNAPIALPTKTLSQWDEEQAQSNPRYAGLRERDQQRRKQFIKIYASLKAKAGFQTQAEIANASGLHRTQISAIESGKHVPQHKTLQKLAKALGVDIAELL
jgi:DNA-binding XRE family transcriptional regulator